VKPVFQPGAERERDNVDGELASSAVKMAGSLLMVLGLILGLFYVLRKFRFGSAAAAGLSRMRLLSTLNLAPKRTIALVEIRDEWLVVGVGADAVTLLTRMPRPEDPAREDAPESSPERGFGALLRGMTKNRSLEER